MNNTPKTLGQLAYEEDCRRCPTYFGGEKRRPWEKLGEVERLSWERCPEAREWLCVVVGGEARTSA